VTGKLVFWHTHKILLLPYTIFLLLFSLLPILTFLVVHVNVGKRERENLKGKYWLLNSFESHESGETTVSTHLAYLVFWRGMQVRFFSISHQWRHESGCLHSTWSKVIISFKLLLLWLANMVISPNKEKYLNFTRCDDWFLIYFHSFVKNTGN
jgi:fucose 4-O-acetylase-like acetyltransferase